MNTLEPNKCYAGILTLMLIGMPLTMSPDIPLKTRSLARLPGEVSSSQLKQLQQKQIPLTTTIKGTIATPIIWTDNFRSSVTQTTITLDEALLYADGDIALPKNSSLIVEVADWDDAGFVTLNTVAIVYKNNLGEIRQFELPEKALLIRNQDNEPLAFETDNSSRNGNSIIGGLADEAIQTGIRNLPFPGNLGSVVSRTLRDNSRRSQRSNRNIVYSIEEGTTVSIYVNSLLNIEN